MKLYAKIKASRGGREAVKGDNTQLDLYLSQGNKQEYSLHYTTEGIMLYKTLKSGLGGVCILDTINKEEKVKHSKAKR